MIGRRSAAFVAPVIDGRNGRRSFLPSGRRPSQAGRVTGEWGFQQAQLPRGVAWHMVRLSDATMHWPSFDAARRGRSCGVLLRGS